MAAILEPKNESQFQVSTTDVDENASMNQAEDVILTKSTQTDLRHMQRMGRTGELVRNFRLISISSFVALCTAAWELGIFLVSPALIDGGLPSLMYSSIWAFVGFAPVYLSMAEMASMAPISGAQYHWVSEFAPESMQKILSYLTGWTSSIAWQGGNALGVFLTGTLIQALISVNYPDYTAPAWHATLLVVGVVIFAFVGNVFGAKVLSLWQTPVCILHIVGYIAFLIPIWVNAPKASHSQVWGEWSNSGGWNNMVLAVLAGQLTGISNQVGLDSAAHMSEEIKDAGRQVPRAMLIVYVFNMCMIFPTFVTLAYHMPNLDDALNDPTLYPAIYVLRQAMPTGGITAILIVIIVILMLSNVSYLAAVTRDLFAFARDSGLPCSKWVAKIDGKRAIPTNATMLTSVIGICLSLIYLGSPVVFYAITSVCTVALLQCYCLSIGCVLWRRIKHPETLPPAQFPLGKFGVPLNIAAVLFSFWCFFWAFWPQTTPVSAPDFNWASAIFVATLVVAMVYYVFRARHKYHGPVALVEGRKIHTG